MKRIEQTEVEICDLCEVNHASEHTKCLGCGKAICYDCRKTRAKEYPHGVFVSGSGDGLYCNDCDVRLGKVKDKLHAAYLKIQSLRDEAKGFNDRFDVAKKAAETEVQQLFRQR